MSLAVALMVMMMVVVVMTSNGRRRYQCQWMARRRQHGKHVALVLYRHRCSEHVRVGRRGLTGPGGRCRRRINALLLLPAVTEPHAHHFFFHRQVIGQYGYFFGRRLGIRSERFFQRVSNRRFNGRAFLATSADRFRRGQRIAQSAGIGHRTVGVYEPFLQQRFQLAHVFKRQIQRFEPGYCRLREVVAVQFPHRQTDVALSKTL